MTKMQCRDRIELRSEPSNRVKKMEKSRALGKHKNVYRFLTDGRCCPYRLEKLGTQSRNKLLYSMV